MQLIQKRPNHSEMLLLQPKIYSPILNKDAMKNVKRGYFVQVLDKSLLLISENLCKCSLSKVFYLVIAVSLEVQYTVYIENGCKLFFVIFFILHWGQQEVLTTVSFTMLYFYFCVCLYCCFFCLFVVVFF